MYVVILIYFCTRYRNVAVAKIKYMNNIHINEEQIQAQWLAIAQARNDANDLCVDGLLFRGNIYYKDGCWHRQRGNEETLWANTERRLLILTKDLNDDEAWDIREETGRLNTVAFSYERAIPFYKNLRMWTYLLLKGEAGNVPPYDEARRMDVVGPFYENAPIARVNVKKQVGGSSISDATLMTYLETYAAPLRQQIALYDATIIMCCGCSNDRNLILDFVRSQYLPDLQPVSGTGDWIYYSPSTGKIVINSYHPSARIGYEDTYCNLAQAYDTALRRL